MRTLTPPEHEALVHFCQRGPSVCRRRMFTGRRFHADIRVALESAGRITSRRCSACNDEEAVLLRAACIHGLDMRLTVLLEVEESTIRERLDRLEEEARSLKAMVTP